MTKETAEILIKTLCKYIKSKRLTINRLRKRVKY